MMKLTSAIAGTLLLAAAGATLPARSAELAFVLNSAEASVSVVDVKTQTECPACSSCAIRVCTDVLTPLIRGG